MSSDEDDGLSIKKARDWIDAAIQQNPIRDVLFRFIGDAFFERVWDVVACNRLFLSSPATFNDPFDCAVDASLGSDDDVRRAWLEMLARRNVPLESAGTFEEFKSRTLDEMLRRDRYRIACFGGNPHHSLMWSHYANGHRGLALAFDYSVLAAAGIAPTPVMYSGKRLRLQYPENQLDELYLALFQKSDEWKYESEFRISRRSEEGDWLDLPERALCGVYLGMRVTSVFADRVLLLLKNNKSIYVRRDLPVFRALPPQSGYGVDFKQLR